MKVLVTGATGLVGFNVARFLKKSGYDVNALVRVSSPNVDELESLGVNIFVGDITNIDSIRTSSEGCDVIINTVAVVSDWAPAELFQAVTVQGAENACKVASERNVKRYIHISTIDVFGFNKQVKLKSESSVHDASDERYPFYKIKADEIVQKWISEKNLPATILYPVAIIGEKDRSLLPELAHAIIKKEMVFWSKNARIWTSHVNNISSLIGKVIENDKAIGQGYIVHDGGYVTAEDLCKTIAQELNVDFKVKYIPYRLTYVMAQLSEFFAKMRNSKSRPFLTTYLVKAMSTHTEYPINKAKEELGWEPELAPKEALKDGMHWVKKIDPEKLKQK